MSCNTSQLPPFHSQYLLQQEILSHTTSSFHPGWVPRAVLISSCWTCLTFSESIYITCQKAAGIVSSHLHGTQLCRGRGHDFCNRKIVCSFQKKKHQKTLMSKGKLKQGAVADVRQWYTQGNTFAKSPAMKLRTVRALQEACMPGAMARTVPQTLCRATHTEQAFLLSLHTQELTRVKCVHASHHAN